MKRDTKGHKIFDAQTVQPCLCHVKRFNETCAYTTGEEITEWQDYIKAKAATKLAALSET